MSRDIIPTSANVNKCLFRRVVLVFILGDHCGRYQASTVFTDGVSKNGFRLFAAIYITVYRISTFVYETYSDPPPGVITISTRVCACVCYPLVYVCGHRNLTTVRLLPRFQGSWTITIHPPP